MQKNTVGIVIGMKNRADTNRILEVLTCEGDIVYILASGVRRLTSRFMPLARLFSVAEFECTSNGTLMMLRDGKLLGSYGNIEKDTDKFIIVADVIRTAKLVIAGFEDKSKLYALVLTYFELVNNSGEYDICRENTVTATVKLYAYMLYYMGYDVKAYASQRENGGALIGFLDALHGKSVSEAMLDNSAVAGASEAYAIIADIFRDELDIELGEL